MTKRGDKIQANQIGGECLQALGTLLKDWYWGSYLGMGLAHWLKSPVQAPKYSSSVFLCFNLDDLGTGILNPFGGKLGLLQGGCIQRMGLYSVSEHAQNVTQKRLAVGLNKTN